MTGYENMKENDILIDTSCFKEHSKRGLDCQKKDCRYWIESECHLNCALIGAKKGPLTLQEIGSVFNVTRMRICQIEKTILEKISNSLKKEEML